MPAPWHYLDHAASSPLRPEARAAMDAALDAGYGNPSGAHALARAGRAALDDARAELAELVGAAPGEVVFTSGGTEADNLAVRGVLAARGGIGRVHRHRAQGGARAGAGERRPASSRSTTAGWSTSTPSRAQLDDTVTLVSVGLVNNEVGTVQPLDDDRGRRPRARARGACSTPTPPRRSPGSTSRDVGRAPPTSSPWRRTSAAARSGSVRWSCAPG